MKKPRSYRILCILTTLSVLFSGCGDSDDDSAVNVVSGQQVAVGEETAIPPAAGATAQTQLQFTGNANVLEREFSAAAGARIEAGDTRANPRRFVARVTLPVKQGVIRTFDVGLPEPSTNLRPGTTYTIGSALVTAAYVEAVQSQPTAGKIFRATGGAITVVDVSTANGMTTVTLSFIDLELRAQGLAATGSFKITGQASFSF